MRRYSEFVALQAQIQRLFPDLPMPSLPGKWFLKMSEVQLQKRRAGLEQWIQGWESHFHFGHISELSFIFIFSQKLLKNRTKT